MWRRYALGLVATITAVIVLSIGPSSSSAVDPVKTLYFPWVPVGEDVNSEIVIQNLEHDMDAEVNVLVGEGTSDTSFELEFTVFITPQRSMYFDAEELGVDEPGASLVVESVPENGQGAEISAVLKTDRQASEGTDDTPDAGTAAMDDAQAQQPGQRRGPPDHARGGGPPDVSSRLPDQANPSAAANVPPGPVDDDEEDVAPEPGFDAIDGYNAMTPDEIAVGPTKILPIAEQGDGWETTLHIANLDTSGAGLTNVNVTLYHESGESSTASSFPFRPGEVEHIELQDMFQDADDSFTGSVRIESDAPIGIVSERSNSGDELSLSNTSVPEDSAEAFTYASFVNPGEPGSSATLNINNPGYELSSFTVALYSADGDLIDSGQYTIDPVGVQRVDLTDIADISGYEYVTAVVGSELPAIGSVDLINTDAGGDEGPSAMTYELRSDTATTGDRLAVTMVQKANEDATAGSETDLYLFNPSNDPVEAEVTFWTIGPVQPTLSAPVQVDLDAQESMTMSTGDDVFDAMPPNFQGGAVVDVVGGDGEVLGVMTNTTFGVPGDRGVAHRMHRVIGGGLPSQAIDLTLAPASQASGPGSEVSSPLVATATDAEGEPVSGLPVEFTVTGVHEGAIGTVSPDDPNYGDNIGTTDQDGQIEFTYSGDEIGTDEVIARILDSTVSASATVEWADDGEPVELKANPTEADASVDEPHLIEATVLDAANGPVEGADVIASVISGPNEGMALTVPESDGKTVGVTDVSGQALLSYEFDGLFDPDADMTDVILIEVPGTDLTAEVTVTWYDTQ
ncbi:MAG: hypothetical protein EA415_02045 [Sphaerobacteraceae bacterium]|nr:MAG: hypothetical protein EA415_02045 [Sphaerobacteraceae bacterium]